MKWSKGDRVERERYVDDGTWDRQGDKCLDRSPIRTGVVTSVELGRPGRYGPDDVVYVLWDDGGTGAYLEHGIRAEAAR